MSKIQKALKALRDSRSHANAGIGGERIDTHSSPRPRETVKRDGTFDNSLSDGHSTQNDVKPLYGVEKLLPSNRIDLSVEEIEAEGLLPSEEDRLIVAQQFRRIKRPIIHYAFESNVSVDENANVVMMAGALPGAGKSFCAFNLAQSISLERDTGAVLVDADVLKPGISQSLGLETSVGLIDYLVDPAVRLEDILVQTNLNSIIVVPAGRRHHEATELLASRRMREFVALLSMHYQNRAVIFDMPPLLLTSEAQVLAKQAGQIVLIIEARVSSQESVMRALDMLDRQKPINAILNKSRSALGSGYQSDEYGYHSYSADSDGE